MNKIVNLTFSFISGFILFSLTEFTLKEYKQKQEDKKFVDKGFLDYGIEAYGADSGNYPKSRPESFALGRYVKDLVSQPVTAAKIANFIFEAKFGEKCASEQKPLKVTLINDKVWEVIGGKGACIYIQKADAQILSIRK